MTMLHRIIKIEATIKQSATGAMLLHEPAEDAGKDAREAFDAELDQSIEAGHVVIVHTSGEWPSRRIPGVIYESEAFAALCALMAHTPATDGRSKDMLSQTVAAVQGISLPVVCGVRRDSI